MFILATSIEKLPNVGSRTLPKLKRLGIKTIRDLVWHFPARYEDYSKTLPIADINSTGQVVSIIGRVADIKLTRSWRRRMAIINAVVEDESGSIRVVWFNQPYLVDSLRVGTTVSLSGKTSLDKKGLYLSSPSHEKVYSGQFTVNSNLKTVTYKLKTDLVHTARLVPIYPETEGLTSKYLRFLISRLAPNFKKIPDPMPVELLKKYNLPPLATALKSIHFPESIEEAEVARRRFVMEELILFQLRALRDHRQLQMLKAPRIEFDKKLVANFVKLLPFELTNDQRIAAYEILQDLERPFPMNRLLNGDVGSGKTVVALIGLYQTAAAGYQSAVMVPTEILAKQHFNTIKMLLGQLLTTNYQLPTIRIGLLIGSEAKQFPADEITEEKISKKLMVQKIAKGEIDLIIGTHALIQESVKFGNLGLVVIDEQHRFGVEQRMKLVKQLSLEPESCNLKTGLVPHLLSMTATPIPRTLALTIYGDLDISLLKEKPKGRQMIITKIIPHAKRNEAHKFIDEQIEKGRQVFVICPRIQSSDTRTHADDTQTLAEFFPRQSASSQHKSAALWQEVKAVEEEYKKLSEQIFPHRRIAMLHGKLKPKEKEEIMAKFRDGHYDILVSTSVVEVGVDVPNATIMMIESAERFGLAQLHQFRGRVGRERHQSHCFLFTTSADTPAGQRLRAMEKTDDGFRLAEADLKIRGPGEFTGTQQSGLPDFAMASLTDLDLIKKARLEARLLLKDDPLLAKNPLLKQRVDKFQQLTHFE